MAADVIRSHRRDAYELRNLSLGRKLLATALLCGGLTIFLMSWLGGITLVSWTASSPLISRWGDALGEVAQMYPRLFVALFATNIGSLGLLFLVSRSLFRRSALRVRVRIAVGILAVLVLAVHTALWALLPMNGAARSLAGPVGVVTDLVLLFYVAVPLWQMWIYQRWSPPGGKKQRVVIVGGGFAGLYTAMDLDRTLGHHPDLEILLIDRNNYFLFPPLLPSAATGTVESRQVTFPFRRILETTNIIFHMATVEKIDPQKRLVYTTATADSKVAREVGYDYLVLCPGSTTQTFGTPGVTENAMFMRELADAMAVRDRVIGFFEQAATLSSREAKEELLRFVIVGAGPTGIEVATELHDLIYHVLLNRYPEVDASLVDIVVVQSGDQILPGWDSGVVGLAQRQLATLRIRLILNARVAAVGPDTVVLKAGGESQTLRSRTCIWCAGVQPSPLLKHVGLTLDRSGRAAINDDLRAVGQERVFVLGDSAYLLDKKTSRPLPPLGQVAFQQGPHAARNLVRLLQGRPTQPFRYFDFGALVSVGEHYAAVRLVGINLSGFLGWLVWRALYLMKLVGISNKIRVLLDWTLDLLIERSITQIGYGTRAAVDQEAPAVPSPPAAH